MACTAGLAGAGRVRATGSWVILVMASSFLSIGRIRTATGCRSASGRGREPGWFRHAETCGEENGRLRPRERKGRRQPGGPGGSPGPSRQPAGQRGGRFAGGSLAGCRSEEHTSELQSLMRISYAVFCLQKKKKTHEQPK